MTKFCTFPPPLLELFNFGNNTPPSNVPSFKSPPPPHTHNDTPLPPPDTYQNNKSCCFKSCYFLYMNVPSVPINANGIDY